jgi:hypothetical protein
VLSFRAAISTATKRSANCAPIWARQGRDLPVRRLKIRAGHRTRFWERNCIAVGLAGFLEPLEASAIVLIELSAGDRQCPPVAKSWTRSPGVQRTRPCIAGGRIVDFLKLPLCADQRMTRAFWRDNRRAETMPDRLRELMALWRYQTPWMHDEFDRVEEVFLRQLSICPVRHGPADRDRAEGASTPKSADRRAGTGGRMTWTGRCWRACRATAT